MDEDEVLVSLIFHVACVRLFVWDLGLVVEWCRLWELGPSRLCLGAFVLLVSCGPCSVLACVKDFVVAHFSHRCGAAQVVDRLTKLLALLLACWVAACFRLLFPLVLKGAGLFIGCLVECSEFFSFLILLDGEVVPLLPLVLCPMERFADPRGSTLVGVVPSDSW